MSNSTRPLEPDDRLRSLNPVPDSPSDADIDAALQRLLTRLPTAEPSSWRAWLRTVTRRRIALGGTLAAAGAVGLFVVVNVLPASPTPGAVSDAWAKHVIAHAATAVAGPGSGILHVVERETLERTSPDGPVNETYNVQSWDSQTAPFARWVAIQSGSRRSMTTISGHTEDQYHSASNTLIEIHWTSVPPFLQQGSDDPAYQAAAALVREQDPGAAQTTTPEGSSSSQGPETFSDLIVQLVNAPGVSVNPNANVNGEPAISIDGKTEYGTDALYVQPDTYTPLELVTTNGSGSTQSTITATFSTYETLPPGSVAMPDLAQLYPSARIVPATGEVERNP